MSIRKLATRAVTVLAVTGALAGLAASMTTATASASTIQKGWLQICAQGNYPAYVHVLSEPIPNSPGMYTGEWVSPAMTPGVSVDGAPAGCLWKQVPTDNVWVQVDVVGLKPNGQEFWLGDEWYNSNVSGMGIGAEGTPSNYSIATW